MKVLELMHSLEEAYDRFGDIEIRVNLTRKRKDGAMDYAPIELIIESEEFIIKCE